MSMKKTMIYVPDEMHRYLAREAGQRGVSMAHVIREAVSQYRAERTGAAPSVSALFGVLGATDPDQDVALAVDETLAEHYREGGEWERGNGLADAD